MYSNRVIDPAGLRFSERRTKPQISGTLRCVGVRSDVLQGDRGKSPMGKKRKRPAHGAGQSNRPQKRPNTSPGPKAAGKLSSFEPPSSTSTTHPVLSLYYPRVVKLRSYILELLPPTSKSRRRKVASLGSQNGRVNNIAGSRRSTASQSQARNGDEADRSRAQEVAELLDTTLVGVLKQRDHADAHSRQRDFAAFTQSQFRSSRLRCTEVCATSSQSEVSERS
ncbi:hypothetical protein CISG_10308 [Coccidioides immitis RMSCC 3703]|uniref:Uncharacterized protein n=1 Tax=Coccidioides immitis RMSCC 3703 TaxID=454286 RepID=A0A0J8QPW2_COCIT|nr:hypothetical protein CISG_10308 [Coccidioides immitis RMSCC 3703]